jgi:hypothetical protein
MPAFPGGGVVTVFHTGQFEIVTTGLAAQLPALGLVNGVTVVAAQTNSAKIFVGTNSNVSNVDGGAGNGIGLAAGASFTFPVANMNQLWIVGNAGDFVYIGAG